MTETLDDLKRAAAERGHDVSDSQLERWRAKGLLPRPVGRKSLGRYGSKSFYPDGTSQQLVDLLYIKNNVDRRLDAVGDFLWGLGYPVVRWARTALEEYFQAKIEHYDTALSKYEEGDIDNPISRVGYEALRGPMAQLRRRVGKRHFPAFMRIMYEVMAGYFTPSSAEEEAVELEVFQGAMRLDGKDEDLAREMIQWMYGHMTKIVEPTQHLEAARSASSEDLLGVRDEALVFWRQLGTYIEGLPSRMPWAVFKVWFMIRLGSAHAGELLEAWSKTEKFQETKRDFFSGSMDLPPTGQSDE